MKTPPSDLVLETGALRLRARVWPTGAPSSPPVLLLHATSFCGAVWEPVWRAACASGASAIAVAPDSRGHGVSDAPVAPGEYAWTRLAGDVAAWIDALPALLPQAEGGVLLAGHSSGATTALAAAAERPGRVRGVLAVEPVLYDVPGANGDSYPGSRFMAAQALRRRARFASAADARERLTARPPFAGFAAESLEAFVDGGLEPMPSGEAALRCAPAVESACYEGAAALDLWPKLARIGCSVRLVAGSRGFMPPALTERIQKALPGTVVETIDEGTHFVALERPRQVGETLARFLREVTPSRVA